MARKKRRGVTLFELLRKDHAEGSKGPVRPQPGVPQQQPVVVTDTQVAVNKGLATEDPSKPTVGQDDEDGIVVHMTRPQMIGIGAAAVVLLVIFLLIGSRMFGGQEPVAEEQVARGVTGEAGADSEQVAPLASLAERARSEPAVSPEPPIRLPREMAPAGERVERAAVSLQTPLGEAKVREPAAADSARPASLAQGDTREVGLTYVVIQIVAGDAKPSAQEHVAEIRKFLTGKGIRTLAVPIAGGGIKVLSEQGFESKEKSEPLMEKVKQVGKDYASARYMGRYNFASPYAEKCKK